MVFMIIFDWYSIFLTTTFISFCNLSDTVESTSEESASDASENDGDSDYNVSSFYLKFMFTIGNKE